MSLIDPEKGEGNREGKDNGKTASLPIAPRLRHIIGGVERIDQSREPARCRPESQQNTERQQTPVRRQDRVRHQASEGAHVGGGNDPRDQFHGLAKEIRKWQMGDDRSNKNQKRKQSEDEVVSNPTSRRKLRRVLCWFSPAVGAAAGTAAILP